MNYDEIGSVLLGLAYLAFLPALATYIIHAKPTVCRAALLLFLGLVITSSMFKYGAVVGTIVALGFVAIPAVSGLIAGVVMNGMKHSIERRHGPTGVEHNVRDSIAGIYRALWATDH